jgi:hypothetical protein
LGQQIPSILKYLDSLHLKAGDEMRSQAAMQNVLQLSVANPSLAKQIDLLSELNPRKNRILWNPETFFEQLATIGAESATTLTELSGVRRFATIIDDQDLVNLKTFMRTDAFTKVMRPSGDGETNDSLHLRTRLRQPAVKEAENVLAAEFDLPNVMQSRSLPATLDSFFSKSRIKPIIGVIRMEPWIYIKNCASKYYATQTYDSSGWILDNEGRREDRRFDVEGSRLSLAKCEAYTRSGYSTALSWLATMRFAYVPQESNYPTFTTLAYFTLLARKCGVDLPPIFNGSYFEWRGNIYSSAVNSICYDLNAEAVFNIEDQPLIPLGGPHHEVVSIAGRRSARDLEELTRGALKRLSYPEMMILNVAIPKLCTSSQGRKMLDFCRFNLPDIARKRFLQIKEEATKEFDSNFAHLGRV